MIKNGEFCVYNGNEYELNEDNDGNLIIITTNREIIDATFVDEYNSGVYSKIISPNEIQEAYECRTYGLINGYKVSIRKELKDTFFVGTGDRKIADILGHEEDAVKLNERAEIIEERMEELWDDDFGMYLNRRTDNDEFQYRLSPFHFHALFSHRVGQERAEKMIKEHMRNPEEFWGEYILPSIARNDPAYPDNDYWRGRIWAPMNYLVYRALLEYDLPEMNKLHHYLYIYFHLVVYTWKIPL